MTLQLLGFGMQLAASQLSPISAPAPPAADNPLLPAWAVTNWTDSHATFYGGRNAEGTLGMLHLLLYPY